MYHIDQIVFLIFLEGQFTQQFANNILPLQKEHFQHMDLNLHQMTLNNEVVFHMYFRVSFMYESELHVSKKSFKRLYFSKYLCNNH